MSQTIACGVTLKAGHVGCSISPRLCAASHGTALGCRRGARFGGRTLFSPVLHNFEAIPPFLFLHPQLQLLAFVNARAASLLLYATSHR